MFNTQFNFNTGSLLSNYEEKHGDLIKVLQSNVDSYKIYDALDTLTESILIEKEPDFKYYQKFFKNIIKSTISKLNFKKHFKWILHENRFKKLFAMTLVDSNPNSIAPPFIFDFGVVTLREYIRMLLLDPMDMSVDILIFNLNSYTRMKVNKLWIETVNVYLEMDTGNTKDYQLVTERLFHFTKNTFTNYMKDEFSLNPRTTFNRNSIFKPDGETLETLVKIIGNRNFDNEFKQLLSHFIIYSIEKCNISSPKLLDLIPTVLFSYPNSIEIFELLKGKFSLEILKSKVVELIDRINATPLKGSNEYYSQQLLNLLDSVKDNVFGYFKDEEQLGRSLSHLTDWFIMDKFKHETMLNQFADIVKTFQSLWYKTITPQQQDKIEEHLNTIINSHKVITCKTITQVMEIGNLNIDLEILVDKALSQMQSIESKSRLINYILQNRVKYVNMAIFFEYLKENIKECKIPFVNYDIETMDILISINTDLYLPHITINLFHQINDNLKREYSNELKDFLVYFEKLQNQYPKILLDKTVINALGGVLGGNFYYSCMHFELYDLVVQLFAELFKNPYAKSTAILASRSLKSVFDLQSLNRDTTSDPYFLKKFFTFMLKTLQNQTTFFLVASEINVNLFIHLYSTMSVDVVNVENQMKPLVEIVNLIPDIFESIANGVMTHISGNNSTFSFSGPSDSQLHLTNTLIPENSAQSHLLKDRFKSINLIEFDRLISNAWLPTGEKSVFNCQLRHLVNSYNDQLDIPNYIQIIVKDPQLTEELLKNYPKLFSNPLNKRLLIMILDHPQYFHARQYLYSSPHFQSLLPTSESMDTTVTTSKVYSLSQIPDILVSKILKMLIYEKLVPLKYKILLATPSKKFFEIVKKIFQQAFEKRKSSNPLSAIWWNKSGFYIYKTINRSSPWCLLQNVRLVSPKSHDFNQFNTKDFSHLENIVLDANIMDTLCVSDENVSTVFSNVRHVTVRLSLLPFDPLLIQSLKSMPNLENLHITILMDDVPAVTANLNAILIDDILNRLKTLRIQMNGPIHFTTINQILIGKAASNTSLKVQFDLPTAYGMPSTDERVISLKCLTTQSYSTFQEPKNSEVSKDDLEKLVGLKKLVIDEHHYALFTDYRIQLPKLKKLSISLGKYESLFKLVNMNFQSLQSLKELVIQFRNPQLSGPEPEIYETYRNFKMPSTFKECLTNSKVRIPKHGDTTAQPSKVDYSIYKSPSKSGNGFSFGSSDVPFTFNGSQFSNSNSKPPTVYSLDSPVPNQPESTKPTSNHQITTTSTFTFGNTNSNNNSTFSFNNPPTQTFTFSDNHHSFSFDAPAGTQLNSNFSFNQVDSKIQNLKYDEPHSPKSQDFILVVLNRIYENSNIKKLKFYSINTTCIHLLLPFMNNENIIHSPVTKEQPTPKPIWYVSNDYQSLYRISKC
ncbi:SNF2-related domain-containing protein [Tieghemostelium lacteum]|uniref:SNF2-related domain-containing protein n=1 Tax=Tieghemostelium lacteum TaxID=361077 RepID=A0A152A2K9_TIELA|nr:SNF2-related domain-containing protein [Tieghemostelium lacteum]|eukprot:KYR00440.1 SNF2-related domain-containing protein [Tieghemostelium lacteum]